MSTEKKKQYTSIAVKLCAGGMTLAVAGLVYFYSAPKSYRATAKAKIIKSEWNTTNESQSSFGPERLPEECRVAVSDEALGRVITNLNLFAVWAGEFNQGSPLTSVQARDRLKAMLDVHPAPGAMMIEIQAKGTNPVELAQIVNEVTKLYADNRQSDREQASRDGFGSLRARWEAQSVKVQEAEAGLKKMEKEFKEERQVYAPDVMGSLQSRRTQFEDEYEAKAGELAKLKALDPTELRKTLSGPDTNVNPVLAGVLQQLTTASNDLRDTKASHGPDAPETKSAELAVEQLDHQVDGLVNANLRMRSVDLASIKAMLQGIDDEREKVSRSASQITEDTASFAKQDAIYAKAYKDYEALVNERDVLEARMLSEGKMSAIMPGVIAARVVELADPPTKPVSPDGRVVIGALAGGGVVAGTGLALLVLLAMKPRGVEEKAG